MADQIVPGNGVWFSCFQSWQILKPIAELDRGPRPLEPQKFDTSVIDLAHFGR